MALPFRWGNRPLLSSMTLTTFCSMSRSRRLKCALFYFEQEPFVYIRISNLFLPFKNKLLYEIYHGYRTSGSLDIHSNKYVQAKIKSLIFLTCFTRNVNNSRATPIQPESIPITIANECKTIIIRFIRN